MEEVILVIHLFLALGIIGLVLIQRSEGGGLGIGGGGGMGGLATPRGTASLLTRLTAVFAALFFATSLILGILAGAHSSASQSVLDALQEVPESASGVLQETTNMVDEASSDDPTEQEPPSAPLPE